MAPPAAAVPAFCAVRAPSVRRSAKTGRRPVSPVSYLEIPVSRPVSAACASVLMAPADGRPAHLSGAGKGVAAFSTSCLKWKTRRERFSEKFSKKTNNPCIRRMKVFRNFADEGGPDVAVRPRGNAVRAGDSTRCCESRCTSKQDSHCHCRGLVGRRFGAWDKSEDLPPR